MSRISGGKNARAISSIGGALLLVLGVSVWLYLVITDQCDPDYSPPVNLVMVELAFWSAIVGASILVAPRLR